MRNIFWIMLLLPVLTVAQAYQTTKPTEGRGEIENGVYYKDINNVFNGFEGTYEYNGPTYYFKMELKKIFSNLNYFCEDVLIGKYRYTKDGMDNNYMGDNMIGLPNDVDSKISLNIIHPAPQPNFCPQCPSDKWLMGTIRDPVTNKGASLYVAKRTVNGQQGIQVWFRLEADIPEPWESEGPIQLPISNFYMTKIQ